jgi:hypothetical protein
MNVRMGVIAAGLLLSACAQQQQPQQVYYGDPGLLGGFILGLRGVKVETPAAAAAQAETETCTTVGLPLGYMHCEPN